MGTGAGKASVVDGEERLILQPAWLDACSGSCLESSAVARARVVPAGVHEESSLAAARRGLSKVGPLGLAGAAGAGLAARPDPGHDLRANGYRPACLKRQ